MEKIDELKCLPEIGKRYFVPCIVKEVYTFKKVNSEWVKDLQGEYHLDKVIQEKETIYYPIINYPHNDIENGQKEIHYHGDTRFIDRNNSLVQYIPRHIKKETTIIKYLILKCISIEQLEHSITPIEYIKNSKLTHDCIYKGKCPHKGYDLSQTPAIEGIITCPLHGLKFYAGSGNLCAVQ